MKWDDNWSYLAGYTSDAFFNKVGYLPLVRHAWKISLRGYDTSFLARLSIDTEISSRLCALLLLSLPIMEEITVESTSTMLSFLSVRGQEVCCHWQAVDTGQQSTR